MYTEEMFKTTVLQMEKGDIKEGRFTHPSTGKVQTSVNFDKLCLHNITPRAKLKIYTETYS